MAPSLRTIIAKLKKAHNEGGIRKKAWAKLKGLVGKSKKSQQEMPPQEVLPQNTIDTMKASAEFYKNSCLRYAKLRVIFETLANLTKELESTQSPPQKMDRVLNKRKQNITSQVGIAEIKFNKTEKCSDKTISNLLQAVGMKNLDELEKKLRDSHDTCDMLCKICDDLRGFYEFLADSGKKDDELYERIKGHEYTLNEAANTYFSGNDEQYTTDLGYFAKKVISSLYSADPSQSKIPHVFIVQPIPGIETILEV